MSVIIFTDGSSRGNPGPGGWGAIVATEESVCEYGGSKEETTNNRMELTAAIEALSTLDIKTKVTLYTDSAYLISGITSWVFGWKKNNWQTKEKEPVLNRDLWEKLHALAEFHTVDWQKISGHSGVPGNERCDLIATAFADREHPSLYRGERSKYFVSLSVSAHTPTALSGKHKKPFSYVSMVDGVVHTHKDWEDCKKEVEGKSKARFKKVFSAEEEADTIRQFKSECM